MQDKMEDSWTTESSELTLIRGTSSPVIALYVALRAIAYRVSTETIPSTALPLPRLYSRNYKQTNIVYSLSQLLPGLMGAYRKRD